MSEPVWLTATAVIAIHDDQLAKFGGPSGLRDPGLLESAVERARNKWSYAGAELPELAAAYAFGIAQNHPFIDGNKRTALLALYTFLGLNGVAFEVAEPDFVATMLALAAGTLSEETLAQWIRRHWPSGAAAFTAPS